MEGLEDMVLGRRCFKSLAFDTKPGVSCLSECGKNATGRVFLGQSIQLRGRRQA